MIGYVINKIVKILILVTEKFVILATNKDKIIQKSKILYSLKNIQMILRQKLY